MHGQWQQSHVQNSEIPEGFLMLHLTTEFPNLGDVCLYGLVVALDTEM